MNQSALQSYQVQQIMTASPAKLVALLYDKAISCLGEAIAAIEKGEIAARHNANRKVIDIVAHLWGTLDLERGGEIAANLDRLYDFIMRRLSDIDMKNDAQAARDVIGLLDPLRKSWHELAAQPSPEAPQQVPQQVTQQAPARPSAYPADPGTPAPGGAISSVTISA